jgi:light-harvesting complex I chlorophyll a/b binding protein 5
MLGVVGVLVPDLLTKLGAMNVSLWTEVGALKFDVADTTTLFLVQMVLFSFAEHKRLYDIKNPGSQGAPGTFAGLEAALGGSGKVGYPGKIFDPLNLSKDPKEFATLQVKELKNGRLAMLAFAGFAGQTYSTGESPIANLTAHLADPWHTTVATNTVAIPHILGF